MNENKIHTEEFDNLDAEICNLPKDSHRFVSNSFTIVSFISDRLRSQNMTQKDLAEKLGKNESEVSKWVSGMHNITLRSISKIESILGISFINPRIEIVEEIPLDEYSAQYECGNESYEEYDKKYGVELGAFVSYVGGMSAGTHAELTKSEILVS